MNNTQGDWRAIIDDQGPYWLIRNDEHIIAKVGWGDLTNIEIKEVEADAHLIAAAPDLYEALLSALGSLVALGIQNQSWGNEVTEYIKKALAKAEGREL
jgi:hypothetical protein